jgi:hypothetical protein
MDYPQPDLTTEQKDQAEESKKLFKLLDTLNGYHEFTEWRDLVVKPQIDMLEAELNSAESDKMSEVVLRAKLKHLVSMKYLFYQVFDIAKQNI